MPRGVAVLEGLQFQRVQVPVTLVLIDIPGNVFALHDLDVPLYVRESDSAVAVKPTLGYTEFLPYAFIRLPNISQSDEASNADSTITLANQDEEWTQVKNAGRFRDAWVTIWKGQLRVVAGEAPETAEFVGAVKYHRLQINTIDPVTEESATIILGPPRFFSMQLGRTFTDDEFPNMPADDDKFVFGYTEVEDSAGGDSGGGTR